MKKDRVIACYKPRLAAQVAKKLDEESRRRFCSHDGGYVGDQHLAKALINEGLAENARVLRAMRTDGRPGDFYLILRPTSGRKVEISGTITLE